MIKRGHDSCMLLGHAKNPGAAVASLPPMSWLNRLTYHGLNLTGLNYVGIQGTRRIANHPFFIHADVVHYQNLHGGYFNYLALPHLTRLKPSVWTLHDMWALTGHCANGFDCQRWLSGCGRCPYPRTDPPVRRDATHWEWHLKRRVYRNCHVVVTAPSQWLANSIRKSILGMQPVHHIPNAVDTNLYTPGNRQSLRAKLGWPLDATVLLFASDTLANPFKHFGLLLRALSELSTRQKESMVLAMLGEDNWRGESLEGIRLLRLGYHDDDKTKALFYAASDLFVHPTRADNQPRVLLEAMACGCPSVASNVGGVPELIRHGETGYLAAMGDASELRRGIEHLTDNPTLRIQMGENARRLVEENHGADRHVSGMVEIYEKAIQDWHSRNPGD